MENLNNSNKFEKLNYIRLEEREFGFITNEIHEILDTDILISEEDYDKFFEMQSSGSQFRLKEKIEQKSEMGLFDYVETFVRESEVVPYVPTETDLLKEEMTELKKLVEQLLNK